MIVVLILFLFFAYAIFELMLNRNYTLFHLIHLIHDIFSAQGQQQTH